MPNSNSHGDIDAPIKIKNYGKTQVSVCPHCSQEVVEHKQWLGLHLVKAITVFYHAFKREVGAPSRLPIQKSARDSFSKLKYFNFIKMGEERGTWSVTIEGENFILGKTSAPRALWTHLGKVVRIEDRRDYINNVIKEFEYRRDMFGTVKFVEPKAKPKRSEIQTTMFEEAT